MDRVKGLQKDYDMWMEDQLNDYVLPVDKTKPEHSKLDKKIENAATVVSNHHSPQKLKASPIKKISLQNCDFIQYWTQFPMTLLLKFLWFLTPGEIIKLSWTCKQAHNTLNTQDIWAYLFRRLDPGYSVPDLTGIDARLYYKYYLYTQWIGTLYHTGYLYQPDQHDDPSIAELTKNIVDFALVKSTKMKYLLREELKIEDHCIDDLKLSLDRETNEVYIWLSGLELGIKGVKPSELPIPSPLILRVFICKENEFIKDTFFLGETFLVLEIGKQIETSKKPTQKEEEQKTNEGQTDSSVPKYYSSFMIYNLQDEIRSLVLDEGETTLVPSSSIRCNFSKGKNRINESVLNEKDTKVHDIVIDNISEDGKFEVRLLNEEEIIFITTSTKLPEVVVLNTSINKIHRKTIELENTMKKLINSAKNKESDQFVLYIADDKENVLNITFNPDSSPEIKNIVEQTEETSHEKIPLEKRFLETIRKYHHGSYKNAIKDISGEYLILFNGKVFTFIDVSKQKTCEFSYDKDFYNWTVFENKLCLLCHDNIRLFNISFGDEQGPQITPIGCTTFDETPEKCQFRWIMMNPCFTVIIDASQRTAGNSPILKLMVGSTQWLFYCAETLTKYEHWISDRKGTLKKWGSKEIILQNFLEEKLEKWEIMPDLKQENFSTKFEGEKLLIKGEKYNIFFDFVVKTERRRLYPRYMKINLSQIFAVEPSSEKKTTEEKKKIYLVHQDSLRENRNQGDKKLESISHNWKKKEEDNDEKEGKVTKKTSPNKGKKYFKNVRQDSRQRKTDI